MPNEFSNLRVDRLLTALSGSLPIKVKISATVETKVLTFTSESV